MRDNSCKESSRAWIYFKGGLISPDLFHIEGSNEQSLSTISGKVLLFFNNILSKYEINDTFTKAFALNAAEEVSWARGV